VCRYLLDGDLTVQGGIVTLVDDRLTANGEPGDYFISTDHLSRLESDSLSQIGLIAINH
jgi:hypothetical protein